MNLLLIRHAEPDTEDGPRPDPPLSLRGRGQASALARWLTADRLAAVYTSPLRRAGETASYLSAAPTPVAGLAEVGGAGEYVAAEVMRRNGDPRWPALLAGDLAAFGTDVATFRAAVVDAIEGIVAHHPGDTVAVVSHAAVINAYLGAQLGIRDRLIWSTLDYASVTRVIASRQGVRTLAALNERAHHCGQPAEPLKESPPCPVGS
ncbi:MAG: histidine phosphatase family protein [Actinomycetota bacterium]